MSEVLWNLQWLDHNSQRSYPLTSEATKRDLTGDFELPDDVLLALYLPINAALSVQPDRFYLRELLVTGTGYRFSVGYDDNSTEYAVASASVVASAHEEYKYYYLLGEGDFDDTVGFIVLGSLDSLQNLAPGSYKFSLQGANIESDCIRPMLRGIQSLRIDNLTEQSPRLYGDITLSAGRNIRLTATQSGDQATIVIDAIDGEGLNLDCDCQELQLAPAIRTINGIPPDDNGNIQLVGSDCITFTPSGSTIKADNPCSVPCFGCEELDILRDQLQRLADGVSVLEDFVERLQTEVTQLGTAVIGSKLGDQGCNS